MDASETLAFTEGNGVINVFEANLTDVRCLDEGEVFSLAPNQDAPFPGERQRLVLQVIDFP